MDSKTNGIADIAKSTWNILRLIQGALLILAISSIEDAYAVTYEPVSTGHKYYSKDGDILQFMQRDDCNNSCAIHFRGKLLLELKKSKTGYQRYFTLHNLRWDFLNENGKKVKSNGHLILLRLLVQDTGGLDDKNRYWLIDISDKEPAVVGPIGENAQDLSEQFTVLWGKKGVTLVLDEGGYEWKQGDRYFVEGLTATNDDGVKLPVMTLDGKAKKTKDYNFDFHSYHYDYATKKLAEVLLMED